MTTKDSICIKCSHLVSYSCVITSLSGERRLMSECMYGGKNAGNRKKCSKFKMSDLLTIERRLKRLTGGEG